MNVYPIKQLIILGCLFLPSTVFAQTAFITTQPESRSVHPGSMVIFGVSTLPGQYSFQWLLDGEAIPDANDETITIEAKPDMVGVYSVLVSDGQNSEESVPASLTLRYSLGVALDQELVSWSTRFSVTGAGIQKVISQENYWLSQSEDTFDGEDALVIKSRPNELDAYILEGDFSGAFTISFKWKADRPDLSFLQFRVKDILSDEIVSAIDKPASGLGWEEVSMTVLNPNNYRMSWVFATVYPPEALTAWLDQIELHIHDAYEVWAILNFSEKVREHLGNALALADSDGDGISNQLEWALFSDPNRPDSPLDFQITEKEGERHAAFSFTENPTLGNYELVMESSGNLNNWIQIDPIISEASKEGEVKTVWQDPVSLNGMNNRFLRLRLKSPR